MTGKWIAFFNAVIVAAKKDYKLNLIDTRQLVENDSVVYMKGTKSILYSIDKPIYDQVVPELHRVNDVPDVKEGMLVMNYPTNVISVNPTSTFLYRDEIFLVTNVSELGVKGVIINPYDNISLFYKLVKMRELVLKPFRIIRYSPSPKERVKLLISSL